MSHHFHNGDMFYCVKSFSKVQFKNNNLFFALMTLVNIFKTPGQTILNGSVSNETILVCMYEIKNKNLQSLS